jgi:uncharacterized protein (DUF58 family)
MLSREVLQKIRRIQIKTSHVVDELLAGQWHSAFKGRGMEFEEVRPYTVGDDVRTIDWNVTARTGEPFVKLFREERELSVQLLVDLSGSQDFGTQQQTKRDLVAEIAATLAFSAIKNNDKVGLTLFTDRVEKAIPPRRGTRHVLRLIRELLADVPRHRGTDLTVALNHLDRTATRRHVVFLISDFLDEGFENALKVARRKHDVIPLIVSDRREAEIPPVGLLRLRDAESGRVVVLDSSSRRHRRQFAEAQRRQAEARETMFRRMKLEAISFRTGEDFVHPLQRYFYRRELRR